MGGKNNKIFVCSDNIMKSVKQIDHGKNSKNRILFETPNDFDGLSIFEIDFVKIVKQ